MTRAVSNEVGPVLAESAPGDGAGDGDADGAGDGDGDGADADGSPGNQDSNNEGEDLVQTGFDGMMVALLSAALVFIGGAAVVKGRRKRGASL